VGKKTTVEGPMDRGYSIAMLVYQRVAEIELNETPYLKRNKVWAIAEQAEQMEVPAGEVRSVFVLFQVLEMSTPTQTIHEWHIYLHLVDFYGKCR